MMISIIHFLLAIIFVSRFRHSHQSDDDLLTGKGLLVIPGLGSPDRLETVKHNLRMLNDQFFSGSNPRLDCIIYIYAPRNDSKFWSKVDDLNYLRSYCRLVDHPCGKVTTNLYFVQPFFIMEKYTFVFTLLDDCKLTGTNSFPLQRILTIMVSNQLTVASPRVIGANKGGGQEFRTIMQRGAMKGTVGYVSSFVEIFAYITTIKAFQALWELLYPAVNPFGWGYDMWYDGYALSKVSGHRMGIISVIDVKHEQNFLAINGGRTETATMGQKWRAVIDQEIYYKRYMGIDLRKCRKNSRMSNSSWNGPVLGYLYET